MMWWDPLTGWAAAQKMYSSYTNVTATQWGLWYKNAAAWLEWYAKLMFPVADVDAGSSSLDSTLEMDFFTRDSTDKFDSAKRAGIKTKLAEYAGASEEATTLEFIPGTATMAARTMAALTALTDKASTSELRGAAISFLRDNTSSAGTTITLSITGSKEMAIEYRAKLEDVDAIEASALLGCAIMKVTAPHVYGPESAQQQQLSPQPSPQPELAVAAQHAPTKQQSSQGCSGENCTLGRHHQGHHKLELAFAGLGLGDNASANMTAAQQVTSGGNVTSGPPGYVDWWIPWAGTAGAPLWPKAVTAGWQLWFNWMKWMWWWWQPWMWWWPTSDSSTAVISLTVEYEGKFNAAAMQDNMCRSLGLPLGSCGITHKIKSRGLQTSPLAQEKVQVLAGGQSLQYVRHSLSPRVANILMKMGSPMELMLDGPVGEGSAAGKYVASGGVGHRAVWTHRRDDGSACRFKFEAHWALECSASAAPTIFLKRYTTWDGASVGAVCAQENPAECPEWYTHAADVDAPGTGGVDPPPRRENMRLQAVDLLTNSTDLPDGEEDAVSELIVTVECDDSGAQQGANESQGQNQSQSLQSQRQQTPSRQDRRMQRLREAGAGHRVRFSLADLATVGRRQLGWGPAVRLSGNQTTSVQQQGNQTTSAQQQTTQSTLQHAVGNQTLEEPAQQKEADTSCETTERKMNEWARDLNKLAKALDCDAARIKSCSAAKKCANAQEAQKGASEQSVEQQDGIGGGASDGDEMDCTCDNITARDANVAKFGDGAGCGGPPEPNTSTPVDIETAFLLAHNAFRSKHFAPELTWDATIAKSAQAFADTCPCDHSNPSSRANKGENIAWGQGTADEAVMKWYAELASYDFDADGPMDADHVVGHFTQVVWKGTSKIGCGYKTTCSTPRDAKTGGSKYGGLVWVCQYSPHGNTAGQYKDNVLPAEGTGHDVEQAHAQAEEKIQEAKAEAEEIKAEAQANVTNVTSPGRVEVLAAATSPKLAGTGMPLAQNASTVQTAQLATTVAGQAQTDAADPVLQQSAQAADPAQVSAQQIPLNATAQQTSVQEQQQQQQQQQQIVKDVTPETHPALTHAVEHESSEHAAALQNATADDQMHSMSQQSSSTAKASGQQQALQPAEAPAKRR